MSMLRIQDCSKQYPGASTWAVRDVSLQIQPGESLVLVGESGSGKTTLLRMIAGFEVPTHGSIGWDDQLLVDDHTFVEPEHRRMGMLFQDFALFPHLTVLENVMFGLHRMPKAQRRHVALATLARVQLEGYEERYPHMLSGGQQQRVALARALAPEPKMLLLDEPFSNLDALVKAEVRDAIFSVIRGTGISTVSVMHDMEDAMQVADQLALLQHGNLLQCDTPERLYQAPKNPYVARFLGKTNILQGIATEAGFETAFGLLSIPHTRESGTPQTFSIRPEAIYPVAEQEGTLRGVVTKIGFVGWCKEITLCPMASTSVAETLSLQVDSREAMAVGETIHVTYHRDMIHTFAETK